MRRTASALFILAMVLGSSTPAASGEEVMSSRQFTGSFEGTGVYETLGPVCPVVHEVFTGTYELDLAGVRGGTYTMDVCIDGPNDEFEWPFQGTFEIVTGQGFSLTGTAEGYVQPNDISGPIVATLTVTDSPGARPAIRGTITVDGITDQSSPPAPPGTSVERGTFGADLRCVR